MRRLAYTFYVTDGPAHTSIFEHLKCPSTETIVVDCLHIVDKNYRTNLTRYGGAVTTQDFHTQIPFVYNEKWKEIKQDLLKHFEITFFHE